MPSEYTPTTEEVRWEWAERRADGYSLVMGDAADKVALEEFDRWLAAHDVLVRADEREKCAQAVEAQVVGQCPCSECEIRQTLAAAIRSQTTQEDNR